MHIKMGDDRRYSATGFGIVTFKSEKASLLHLKDVMFVPRLKKDLIFVVVLEDKGYDVIFCKGKSFM